MQAGSFTAGRFLRGGAAFEGVPGEEAPLGHGLPLKPKPLTFPVMVPEALKVAPSREE